MPELRDTVSGQIEMQQLSMARDAQQHNEYHNNSLADHLEGIPVAEAVQEPDSTRSSTILAAVRWVHSSCLAALVI